LQKVENQLRNALRASEKFMSTVTEMGKSRSSGQPYDPGEISREKGRTLRYIEKKKKNEGGEIKGVGQKKGPEMSQTTDQYGSRRRAKRDVGQTKVNYEYFQLAGVES